MNKVQTQTEIMAIKRYLKKCCFYFGVGLMLASAGFIAFGDGFFNDLTGTFLGRLPAYLLLGLWVSGMYVAGTCLTEQAKTGHRASILNASSYYFFFLFAGMLILIPSVVKRIRRLRALEKSLYWP